MSTLSRRSFLRTLGLSAAGATLLSPFMTRTASAAGARPCRFVFIVEGNGFYPITMLADQARAAIDATRSEPLGGSSWWSRSYSHDAPIEVAATDFQTGLATSPLTADAAVASQAAVLFGLSSKIIGGGHSGMHGVLASARTVSGIPGGQTIDDYLASLPQVRQDTPFSAVRLAVGDAAKAPISMGLCAYGPRRPAPVILSPARAYEALFSSVGDDASRAWFQRQGGMLDFARQDISASLRTFPGNSRERAKLESYLQSVEELQRRHDRLIDIESQIAAVQTESPLTNPLYGTSDPLDRFRAHLQLATAALKGDLTNVAVIGSGTGGQFGMTYTLSSVGRHDLHHSMGKLPEYAAIIYEITRLQVEAITQMAADLAATPEANADGSMLDHTVIVFIGDNGEQHHSKADEFPTLVIGGRALGLNLNSRTLIYPGLSSSNHRQVSNLWNTLGHLTGDDLNTFGGEGRSRRADGPLSELMT
jgi:hypothetical protein